MYYLQPPLEVLDLVLVVVESPLEVTVVPGGSLFEENIGKAVDCDGRRLVIF